MEGDIFATNTDYRVTITSGCSVEKLESKWYVVELRCCCGFLLGLTDAAVNTGRVTGLLGIGRNNYTTVISATGRALTSDHTVTIVAPHYLLPQIPRESHCCGVRDGMINWKMESEIISIHVSNHCSCPF